MARFAPKRVVCLLWWIQLLRISGSPSSRTDRLTDRLADPAPDLKDKPDRADIDLARILNLPGRALLDEYEAAEVLHVSVRVLRAWRCRNIGPKYLKLNRTAVRYKLDDLWAYQDAQPMGGEGAAPRKARGARRCDLARSRSRQSIGEIKREQNSAGTRVSGRRKDDLSATTGGSRRE